MAIKAVIGKDGKNDTLTNKNKKSGLTIMAGKTGDDTYIVNNISKNWTVINDKDEEEDYSSPDANDKLIVKNLNPQNAFLFFDVSIKNSEYDVQSQVYDCLYVVNKGMTNSVLSQVKSFFQTENFNKFSKGAIGIEYYFGNTNNWDGSEYGSTYGDGYINTIQISDSKGALYTLDQNSYINDVRKKVTEYLEGTQYITALHLLEECEDNETVEGLINIYKNATLKFTEITGSKKADTIYGGDGDTSINGSKGNDIIYAGEGIKTITIDNGHGNDTIYLGEDSSSKVYLNIDSSNISYGKGVNSNENDLYIYSQYETVVKKKTVTKTQTITIKDYFTKNSQLYLNNTEINNSYLSSFDVILQGISNKNNTMTGVDNFNQTFTGGKKSDIINTGTGNNTVITGAKGSTEITSYNGNDTFIVNNLKTYTNITDAGGNDSLQIKSTNVNDIALYYDSETDTLRISNKKSIAQENKNNVTINNFILQGIETVQIAGNNLDVLSWLDGVNNRVAEYLSQKGVSTVSELMSIINTMSKKNKSKALTEFYNVILTYKRGTDRNDKLTGTNGNDTIYGDDGNDTIKGGKGNDFIVGGKGNDKLYGEKGNNTFEFSIGDGSDTIYKSTKNDSLKFTDIKFEDLKFSKQSNNLIIENGHGDSVTLNGFFNSKSKLDTIYEKNNSEAISVLENAFINISGSKTVKGTDYNDIITGSSNNDKLYGYKGNNTFIFDAGSGSDTIYSGKGTDTIQINNYSTMTDFKNNVTMTSSGNSLIIKYSDTDKITIDNYFKNSSVKYIKIGEETEELSTIISDYAQNHVNEIDKSSNTKNKFNITGTQFNDKIIGSDKADTIKSLAGDDKIYAGKGNDAIYAGSGKNEIYIYEGDGNDTIYTTGGGSDLLVLEDRYMNMIRWTKSKNDLVLTFTNTDDKITLADFFKGSPSNPSVRQIKLADGYIYNISDICKNLPIQGSKTIKGTIIGDNIFGSEKADIIYGYDGDDVIYSYGGKDIIYAGDGKDQIFAGRGDNIIYAGDGDDYISTNLDELYLVSRDTIYAGAGDDEIELGYAFNTVYGEDGADKITSSYADGAKHHTIYAGAGEDWIELSGSEHYIDAGDDDDTLQLLSISNSVIIGGKGDDEIQINSKNGVGNNTLQFTTGDGNDFISGDSTFNGSKILFTDTQNLSFERLNDWDLKINYGNNDSITLHSYFANQNNYEAYWQFKSLNLQNGENASIENLCEVVEQYFSNTSQPNSLGGYSLNQINSDTASWNINTSGEGAELLANNSNNDNINELIAQYSYDNTNY